MTLLLVGLAGIGVLIVFSFSRRRGPVRDLPAPVRATPVEFLEALGSLYAEAGASATVVEIAYERFRRRMGDLCGLKGTQLSAEELASALRRRFPQAGAELEKDLADCAEAVKNDSCRPRGRWRWCRRLAATARRCDCAGAAGGSKLSVVPTSRNTDRQWGKLRVEV